MSNHQIEWESASGWARCEQPNRTPDSEQLSHQRHIAPYHTCRRFGGREARRARPRAPLCARRPRRGRPSAAQHTAVSLPSLLFLVIPVSAPLAGAGASASAAVAATMAMRRGDSPGRVLFAASEGRADELRQLLQAGGDKEELGPNGVTPLMKAVGRGFEDCVQLLLEAGVDKGRVDIFGTTAVMMAALLGRAKCLKMLLEAGAEKDQTAMGGNSAAWLAALKGRADCLHILLEAGADVNRANLMGTSPIMNAAGGGHADCLQMLLKAGADMNKCDMNGISAAHAAAKYGKADCLRLLLKAGAVIDRIGGATGPTVPTELMDAAAHGHADCVRILLEAGADVSLAFEGKTALGFAEASRNDEAAALLRAAAAERRTAADLGALRLGEGSAPRARGGSSRGAPRHACARCGKTSAEAKAEGGKLRSCSACRSAKEEGANVVPPRYCSRACQVAAWPQHKHECAGRAGSTRAREE